MAKNICWLGHDTFLITGPVTIYTDPYKLKRSEPKADLILISHDHGDHCSPEDVAKIQQKDTIIVTTAASAAKLSGDIRVVKPGDKVQVKGVAIEAVPAYNVNKFRSPGMPFHPKESQMVGFVFTATGRLGIGDGGEGDIQLAVEGAFIGQGHGAGAVIAGGLVGDLEVEVPTPRSRSRVPAMTRLSVLDSVSKK